MISEAMSTPGKRTLIEERATDIVFTEMMKRLEQEMLQTKEFQEAIKEATRKTGRALQPEDIFDYTVLKEHFMDYLRAMAPVMIFDLIVERYQPLLYALAMRILGNHHNAEDVVQESLLKAYVALKDYTKEQLQTLRLRAWLCAIVRNTANNYRLQQRRFALLDLSEEIEGSRYEQPETAIILEETAEEFNELMKQLPGKYRAVLVLRYWYYFNYQEIAATLKCESQGTLKSRVHRGIRLLKEMVEDMDIQVRDLERWYL